MAVEIIALIATYNEERFIGPCLDHLTQQGVSVYLIDNESTDQTVQIARSFEGRGVLGIESLSRDGIYRWQRILERKEELATTLDGDWFIHHDADEFRIPPAGRGTLHDALSEVDRLGANAVNFMEFTFVPTREDPNHDHHRFRETMRWYYPFLPKFPHRVNAWKRQAERVRLAETGGHRVQFPSLKLHPVSFPMKHYLFLSVEHAVRKYVQREYDQEELARGWHGARGALTRERIRLPSTERLREFVGDEYLDASDPWTKHWLFERKGNRWRRSLRSFRERIGL